MLVVARHGRTASNAGGLLLGRADPPLDDVGREQAALLADAVRRPTDPPVARIVSSPLTRTLQTAAAIAAVAGVEVEIDDRFVELDYGDWDQRPIGDVPPEEWARWRADPDFAPPGGESLVQLGARVREALAELAAAAADETIVVVTHVSPVKAAVAWALGCGDELSWRMFVSPASITRIATAGPSPSLHVFGDAAHLA